MCLLALEISMLVFGLIGLISGKLPMRGMPLEGKRARIAGLILALPLPLALGIGLLIGVLVGAGALPYSAANAGTVIEIILVLGCLGGAFLYARLTRPAPESTPPPPPPPPAPPTINP